MAAESAEEQRAGGRRIALVIGNGQYVNAKDLDNPPNDARAMAKVLRGLDFEVIEGFDLSVGDMDGCISRFAEKITDADAALFYYAGHGLQVNGENYLVPVDAVLDNESQLARQTISMSGQLSMMSKRAQVSILFLDCCRDNPFVRSIYRTMGGQHRALGEPPAGLAEIELPKRDRTTGSFIAFATEAGAFAADGEGENSPFTAALLKHLPVPGLSLADIMTDVAHTVSSNTDPPQHPWIQSSLRKRFYFIPPAELPTGDALQAAVVLPPHSTVPERDEADVIGGAHLGALLAWGIVVFFYSFLGSQCPLWWRESLADGRRSSRWKKVDHARPTRI